MAGAKWEERGAELERELAALKVQMATLAKPNDWLSAIDKFAGDEGLQQVFEEARKIREEDRRRTRPKASKSKRRINA
jgi:hypothetical protein